MIEQYHTGIRAAHQTFAITGVPLGMKYFSYTSSAMARWGTACNKKKESMRACRRRAPKMALT